MLPNRIVAATLVALLAVQLVPAPAGAQGTVRTADLVIDTIEVGSPVALVSSPVNITVRNLGPGEWSGSAGWQIFVGLNGRNSEACIERGEGTIAQQQPSPATSPCYIRVVPGSGYAVDIPAGQTRTYRMQGDWNPTREQANVSAWVYAEIMTLGDANPGAEGACQGPEPSINLERPACENNDKERHGVFIGNPGVRVVPQREASPTADGDRNLAWKSEEVDPHVCPLSPQPVEKGCKVPAGRSIVASYLVTNVGSVRDSYTAEITPTAALNDLLKQGYTFNFGPSAFSLAAGTNTTVRLTISIPENVTAGNATNLGSATLAARWRSTLAPSVTTEDKRSPGCTASEIYCVNPTLPTFRVDFRRAFNVTANFTWTDVKPGDPAEYKLNITNEGNADDTFNITFLKDGGSYVGGSVNETWAPRIGTSDRAEVFIRQGEMVSVPVQITPPHNVTNGSHWFEVQVKSKFDTTGAAPCKRYEILSLSLGEGVCKVRYVTHVKQVWDIVGFNDVAARVVPAETVEYKLGIKNHGNGYDNVTLELQTTVFGWDVRVSDPRVRLTPFNTSTFTLTVTSPPNTPAGTIGAFYLNATSSGPDDMPLQDRKKASTESLMSIVNGSNIRIDTVVNSSFVDAGATVDFDVLVTNTGNVADNFTIPTPERPADWGASVAPGHLELQPNQQGTVRVSLRAPTQAEVGEKATASVKIRSTVDRTRERTADLEARISGPDLFVDNILVNASSPYTGDPVDVTVVLGNAGNKAHDRNTTLRVYFVQGGVERVIGERTYPPLFIAGQRRLSESFAWDTTGIEGAGVILARIDVGQTVKEIDESAASNERTRPLTLRTFDIAITPAQGLSARPGERLTYGEAPNVFVATYSGNQPTEPVTIRFESEHGWLSSQSELSLALPRGTPIPIIATLEIPTLPGAARDTLTMTIVPALRPDEVIRATTITTIIDEEKPIVRSITATPAQALLGERVTIEVTVEDATGASAATAYITAPNNETSALTLTRVAPDKFRADRAFAIAGRYRVAAEVLDSADPPNKNDTRLGLGSFVMSPGSAPTISLAPGQPTTIRTGGPIKLSIVDPLGIGKASYSIKGVSYDLRAPDYQIDTSTFQAGPVEINVTAENVYGVTTSQRFTFIVDNSAPGITRVTLNPERPRANEDVTITIQTEAKVEAVDVLVKRDGQVVQTLNATKRGVGTFAVTFNPPEGEYEIDVVARDAAGNTRLAEGAVEFTAKPGSPFVPGPAPWLVVVALVVVALLARKKQA